MSCDIGTGSQGSATQAGGRIAFSRSTTPPHRRAVQGHVLLGTLAELTPPSVRQRPQWAGARLRSWRGARVLFVPAAGGGAQGCSPTLSCASIGKTAARRARRSGLGHREHRSSYRHAPARRHMNTIEQVARGLMSGACQPAARWWPASRPSPPPWAMVPLWMSARYRLVPTEAQRARPLGLPLLAACRKTLRPAGRRLQRRRGDRPVLVSPRHRGRQLQGRRWLKAHLPRVLCTVARQTAGPRTI